MNTWLGWPTTPALCATPPQEGNLLTHNPGVDVSRWDSPPLEGA